MTTANPSKNKIRRAMALRKAHPNFIQAVDEEQNARDLSDAAKEAGVVADVVIDVAVGDAERHSGGRGSAGAGAADRQAAQPEAARHALVRRRRPAREGVRRPQGAGAQDHRTERRDLRGDEEVRPEHGDLQRRRHRHLQHHARRARIHRRAGGQLPVHGHAVPGDRQRERRRSVQRLRAVADRADDGDEQPVPGAADDRCRHQGADAQHADTPA